MEFHSDLKKNESMLFARKLIEHETNMLRETSQIRRSRASCFLSNVEADRKKKTKGRGGGGGGVHAGI